MIYYYINIKSERQHTEYWRDAKQQKFSHFSGRNAKWRSYLGKTTWYWFFTKLNLHLPRKVKIHFHVKICTQVSTGALLIRNNLYVHRLVQGSMIHLYNVMLLGNKTEQRRNYMDETKIP